MEVVLPKWGVTMQEATVTSWLAAVGDQVHEGQPLVTVETDKVDGEVESPASGTLSEIRIEPGGVIEVGAVLGIITEAG